MKSGFMLIELIVSTLIASMVGTVLLTALFQGNRFQMAVDTIVDSSMRVGIAYNQLEKDLMGAFIPAQAREKEKKEKPAVKAADKNADNAKETAGKQEQEKKEAEKKEEKLLEKIFYSTNKNNNLDTLTFITDDPLNVYVGKDVGVVKPKVVRVHYSLKPKEEKSDIYVLMRQESIELDLSQSKNARSYELIGGIKECTITFTARIEKKEEKPKEEQQKGAAAGKAPAQKETKKIEYEYKTSKEWISESKKESDAKGTDKKEEESMPRIPYSLEMKLVLWDMTHKKHEDYVLYFEIPTDTTASKEESKKDEAQPAKQNEKKQGEKAEGQPGASDKSALDILSQLLGK